MTRPHSDMIQSTITGSFARRLIVDVFHGSERVMQNLTATSWAFDGDLYADVKHTGSLTVVHQSAAGESLVPSETEGILSPYRAKLLLLMEISAGEFSETVSLGFVRVKQIGYAYDQTATVGTSLVVISSVVQVEFESLEADIAGDGFTSPEQPPLLTSTFDELRRLLPMPLTESVSDAPIPTAVVYEANEGGRLKAVQQHCRTLGGVGMVDPAGVWTIVPDVPVGAPVELRLGKDGTVTDVPFAIDTAEAFTTVVGNFETATRTSLFAKAEFTTGPLAPSDLYPRKTKYITDESVQTQSAADARVLAELQKSLTRRFEVTVQCIINPLIELGDPAAVVGHTFPVDGRVVKYSLSDSPLMNVTLEASRVL